MTDFHSNYNGLVNAQANEWIPTSNQRDIRVVTNPVGLPAAVYMIWYDVADPTNVISQAQFALNMASNAYWVRTPLALPNSWNAWTNIFGGGGAGVASFTGMQGTTRSGAVIAINGDYNAAAITATPSNPEWPIADVNVQLALADLFKGKPIGIAEIVGTTLATGGWLATGVVYQAAASRGVPNEAASWAPVVNGLSFVGPPAAGAIYFSLSGTMVVSGAVVGGLGIRIKDSAGNVITANFCSDDGTGGTQVVSCSCNFIAAFPISFTLEAINTTATNPVTVQRFELDVVDLGLLQ